MANDYFKCLAKQITVISRDKGTRQSPTRYGIEYSTIAIVKRIIGVQFVILIEIDCFRSLNILATVSNTEFNVMIKSFLIQLTKRHRNLFKMMEETIYLFICFHYIHFETYFGSKLALCNNICAFIIDRRATGKFDF